MKIRLDAGNLFALALISCDEPVRLHDLNKFSKDFQKNFRGEDCRVYIDLSRQSIDHATYYYHELFSLEEGVLRKSDRFDSLSENGYIQSELTKNIPADIIDKVREICSLMGPSPQT